MNVRLPSLMGKNCLTASASRLGYSLGLVGVRRHCQRRCRRNDLERRESLPHQVIATDRFPFTQFGTQSGVACSGISAFLSVSSLLNMRIRFLPTNSQGNNIFAAALSDLSPLWTGSMCQGSKDASKW